MRFYLFMSLFLLFSCGSKDTKMCDCLEAGDKLNQLSADLLVSEVTKDQQEEMVSLKKDRDVKCKDFQTMSGEEMLRRKAECQEN